MTGMNAARSLSELKQEYRREVAKHHPDRGGSHRAMQIINDRYQAMRQRLQVQEAANQSDSSQRPPAQARAKRDFWSLRPGDSIYVNRTCGEVREVRGDRFLVVAQGKSRQAWFCRQTGKGMYNPRLRASFFPLQPKSACSA